MIGEYFNPSIYISSKNRQINRQEIQQNIQELFQTNGDLLAGNGPPELSSENSIDLNEIESRMISVVPRIENLS